MSRSLKAASELRRLRAFVKELAAFNIYDTRDGPTVDLFGFIVRARELTASVKKRKKKR